MRTKLAMMIGTCGRSFAVNPEYVVLISTIADSAGAQIEFDDGQSFVVTLGCGEVMRAFRREGATYFADFARLDGRRVMVNLKQIRSFTGAPNAPTCIYIGQGEPIEVSNEHNEIFKSFLVMAGDPRA